jgi:hypothetical protein
VVSLSEFEQRYGGLVEPRRRDDQIVRVNSEWMALPISARRMSQPKIW